MTIPAHIALAWLALVTVRKPAQSNDVKLALKQVHVDQKGLIEAGGNLQNLDVKEKDEAK